MEVKKGDRKYNAQLLSAGIIAAVALGVVVGATMNPASGLATAGAGIIAATGVAIGMKDGTHAWGNAKEHEADASKPTVAGALLVLALAGLLAMPRQAKADDYGAQLVGNTGLSYMVADLGVRLIPATDSKFKHAMVAFGCGITVAALRELLAKQGVGQETPDFGRFASGAIGAGVRAGLTFSF